MEYNMTKDTENINKCRDIKVHLQRRRDKTVCNHLAIIVQSSSYIHRYIHDYTCQYFN